MLARETGFLPKDNDRKGRWRWLDRNQVFHISDVILSEGFFDAF